ncbi:putative feruloyl esterase B-1 [Penicillium oxalicum]|uniref:putative feruloyl esterase B-1 n=1 Tax=Penicillium oxalicum TaxID=69781 RepID=UPI0020B70F42|nr:putative feruloyl esterase B-1 [Penicillium oxalicum]KAI2794222.1 putative feruloyl esterase B-1 [Penicillium oxalicum]
MHLSLLVSGLVATASAVAIRKTDGNGSFQKKCEQFSHKIKVHDATIHGVTYVAAGTNISMENIPSTCAGNAYGNKTPFDFCRVSLNVTTSPKSQIYMEAWLPSNYSGRFLSTGNGGIGGCLQYSDMFYTTQYGFATVATNNGHFGDTGVSFYRNNETVADYAYRAMHTCVVVGKEITKQFYSRGYDKSYYMGCSTGGRQGWKAVQKFPDDFDGVLAGSPAFNQINLINWGARFLTITGNSSAASFVTGAQWATVHEEILRQCDDLDGAADGLIEDPDLCHPVFETLLCNSTTHGGSSSCLTGTQLETVNRVFSPLYGDNDTLLYPRMQPGSEIPASFIYYNGRSFSYATDWFRYVVYSDPSWDPTSWTIHDALVADAQDPFNLSTFQGDISAFQKKKGKVLHYHGMEDPIITSDSSKMYYKHVADTMSRSPTELDDFYRFFPISGMSHCSTGEGAGSIGQGMGTFAGNNPEDNVLLAMVQWVEKGIAPEYVRGTKFNGTAVDYRRKHCKYPKRNKHVGPGPYEDENSWKCV